MEFIETTLKKQVNSKGQVIELTTINHNVFGDCYYIYVDNETKHFQYGTRRLDLIFNEFVTGEFNLVYA
jgi:hypothetical protein